MVPHGDQDSEVQMVQERYARRPLHDPRYSLLNPAALLSLQERQRAMSRLFRDVGFDDLAGLRLIEVGSGEGGNLLELLRFGFLPKHLIGIELLDDRHLTARGRLPEAVELIQGDAASAHVALASCDVVFASTLFSSLLDDDFQRRLAERMWSWIKPGGGVLWYDFTYNNPGNPDVRGVPMHRIRQLFPSAPVISRRVTLAPPLARPACRVHPSLYTLLNTVPWLRTHVLCWIQKDHD